jgi:hypothetical protein
VYIFSTDAIFSNIFDLQLIASTDVEPMGMKGQLVLCMCGHIFYMTTQRIEGINGVIQYENCNSQNVIYECIIFDFTNKYCKVLQKLFTM